MFIAITKKFDPMGEFALFYYKVAFINSTKSLIIGAAV